MSILKLFLPIILICYTKCILQQCLRIDSLMYFVFSQKEKKKLGDQYKLIRLMAKTLESKHHVFFHYKNVNIYIFRSYVCYVDCCSDSHWAVGIFSV